MKPYSELSFEEVQTELAQQRAAYDAFVARGLRLNMARGKPAPEQLDLSMPMLDLLPAQEAAEPLKAGAADDLRNYGGLTGIPEMRELFAAVLGVRPAEVIAQGNSSLTLMYNTVSMAMTHGVMGSKPWTQLNGTPKFLCPVPGYDRHFAICEHFGIEMLPIELGSSGPDMDVIERLVANDELIKGIWCVPRFANPSGAVYSDEVVERFAALSPAASDFRIYWDNAYAVHALDEDAPALQNLAEACEAAGNPHLWFMYASTSKITFAGSGVAALAGSEENIAGVVASLSMQSIGPDKINQKRHALFLPDLGALYAHMSKHAALIRPKFEVVLRVLESELAKTGVGTWSTPQGGYFISFDGPKNTAKRTVELAEGAGVVLTPAGATYPYGDDPTDANIRIAPTYPSLAELETAAEVFAVCARIAALEQMTAHKA